MIVITDAEYEALKSRIKKDVIAEIQSDKAISLNQVFQKGCANLFKSYFPDEEFTNKNRMRKVRQALTTATNVLRSRRVWSLHHGDRSNYVKDETELQDALETFEKMCVAFKDAYGCDYTEDD